MFKFYSRFRTWNEKDLAFLRQAGFDSDEICRLCELRRTYKPDAQDRSPVSQEHLLFIRWLVQHGRLSETKL